MSPGAQFGRLSTNVGTTIFAPSREREEEELAESMAADRSGEALVQIATQTADEMVRLAACLAILERTDGKPRLCRVRTADFVQH